MIPFSIFLYPIYFVGITFGIILLATLVFSLFRFKKAHKKRSLVICFIIIALFAYASVDISLSKTGKVINALSGNPVGGIDVLRVFETTPIVENPGGNSSVPKWYQKVKTDNNGSYQLPLSVHVKMPFLTSLAKVIIDAPVGDKNRELPYYPWQYSPMINYDNDRFEIEYTTSKKLIGDDIYLIPKLTQIEKCDSLVKYELSEECKSANAIGAAIYNKSTDSCSHAFRVNGCIIQTAVAVNDDKLCASIGAGDSDRSLCLRNVASEKKDQKKCNSMSNSKWVSTTDNQGNVKEWCAKIDDSKTY